MFRTRNKLCFIIVLLLTLIYGCDKEPNKNIKLPTQTDNAAIIICLDKYNSTIYKSLSCFFNISFDVVTANKIETATVKIDNIKTPYSLSYSEIENNKLPYYVFQCYQGVDWNRMYNLYSTNVNATVAKDQNESILNQPYSDYMNYYIESYTNLNDKDIPVLYHYEMVIDFDMINSELSTNETVNSLVLNINGQEFSQNIGNIILDYETENNYSCEGIRPVNICTWDKKIFPNEEGTVKIDDFTFTCKNDIKITGFHLMNNDAEINNITFNIDENNSSINQIWDGNPVSFTEGTKLTPMITVTEDALIGKDTYFTILYAVMDYEINGVSYSTYFHSMFRTRPNAYEVYASKVDGINIFSYYFDYYDKTQGIGVNN